MGSLNALEFAMASAALKLEPVALEAARQVLVDGKGQTEVAGEVGHTRQNVHYWVNRVSEVYEKQQQAMLALVPSGWLVQIIAAPPARMCKLRAMAEADMNLHLAGEVPQ